MNLGQFKPKDILLVCNVLFLHMYFVHEKDFIISYMYL